MPLTSLAIPQRYEKIYSKKYSNNESFSIFKNQAERISSKLYSKRFIPDDFLKDNFESKHIKYVLVEKYLSLSSSNSYPFRLSFLYCSEKYRKQFEEVLKNKYGVYIIPITETELDVFSKLIFKVVQDEPMCDISKYVNPLVISEMHYDILITYFNGKKQYTAFFSSPEFSFSEKEGNWQPYIKEITAAQYLMYVWRYASLNAMLDNVFLSHGDSPAKNNKKILNYLDEGIDKVLKEDSDKESKDKEVNKEANKECELKKNSTKKSSKTSKEESEEKKE